MNVRERKSNKVGIGIGITITNNNSENKRKRTTVTTYQQQQQQQQQQQRRTKTIAVPTVSLPVIVVTTMMLLYGILLVFVLVSSSMSNEFDHDVVQHDTEEVDVMNNGDVVNVQQRHQHHQKNSARSTTDVVVEIGFGTAALGSKCRDVVLQALRYGFRMFDTAEADYWYDQNAVGDALETYFTNSITTPVTKKNDSDAQEQSSNSFKSLSLMYELCQKENIKLSTKIGPWDLTSIEKIRSNAAQSRSVLVGFCDTTTTSNNQTRIQYPLDVYIIHAPTCWKGWHPRCNSIKNPSKELLNLRSAWLAMEAIVGIDRTSKRIGLSNVSPEELLDIIQFVQERQQQQQQQQQGMDTTILAPPRIPDVVQAYADPIQPSVELRTICQQHNIEFVSYSTLGTQHQMRTGQQNPVLTHPIIVQLASIYNRSTAEIVLSWAIQNKMSIIPRSSNTKHIYELSRLLKEKDGFLNQNDIQLIDTMAHSSIL